MLLGDIGEEVHGDTDLAGLAKIGSESPKINCAVGPQTPPRALDVPSW